MSQLSRDDILRELELMPLWQLRQSLPGLSAKAPLNGVLPDLPLIQTAGRPEVEDQVISKDAIAADSLPEENIPSSAALQTETCVVEERAETDAPEVHEALLSISAPQTPVTENALLTEMPAQNTGFLHASVQTDSTLLAAQPVSQAMHSAQVRMLLSDDGAFVLMLAPVVQPGDQDQVENLLKNMIRAMRINCRMDMVDTVHTFIAAHMPRVIISLGAEPVNHITGKTHSVEQWRALQQDAQLWYNTLPLIVTYSPEHLLDNMADKPHAWGDLCAALTLAQNL